MYRLVAGVAVAGLGGSAVADIIHAPADQPTIQAAVDSPLYRRVPRGQMAGNSRATGVFAVDIAVMMPSAAAPNGRLEEM